MRSRVRPLAVAGDPAVAFARLKAAVAALPRTTIVSATDDALHAVCRTRLGFPDDFHARLRSSGREIDVRSASRWGWHDLGVNRRRVEGLRQMLEGASG